VAFGATVVESGRPIKSRQILILTSKRLHKLTRSAQVRTPTKFSAKDRVPCPRPFDEWPRLWTKPSSDPIGSSRPDEIPPLCSREVTSIVSPQLLGVFHRIGNGRQIIPVGVGHRVESAKVERNALATFSQTPLII
jgi:hypothetical protein